MMEIMGAHLGGLHVTYPAFSGTILMQYCSTRIKWDKYCSCQLDIAISFWHISETNWKSQQKKNPKTMIVLKVK